MPELIKRGKLGVLHSCKESNEVHDYSTFENKTLYVHRELPGTDSFVSLPTGYGKSIVFTIHTLSLFCCLIDAFDLN